LAVQREPKRAPQALRLAPSESELARQALELAQPKLALARLVEPGVAQLGVAPQPD